MAKNPTDSEYRLGAFLVLLAGVCWGIISVFARLLANVGLAPQDIMAMRCLCALLLLALGAGVFHRKAYIVRLKDLWCMAGCGFVSIALFNICYFATLEKTTVGVAVILLYTSPVFVMIASCLFFGERFTWRKLLAIVMVMAGCVLVSGVVGHGIDGGLSIPVLLTGICSGLCYALYTVFGRFAQMRGYSSQTITLWSFVFAGGTGAFLMDWTKLAALVNGGWQPAVGLAGLVLLSTLVPYCAYTAGLKRLPPSTAAIFAVVEPVVGAVVGIVVFHEKLTWSVLAGMVLILASFFIGDSAKKSQS